MITKIARAMIPPRDQKVVYCKVVNLKIRIKGNYGKLFNKNNRKDISSPKLDSGILTCNKMMGTSKLIKGCFESDVHVNDLSSG